MQLWKSWFCRILYWLSLYTTNITLPNLPWRVKLIHMALCFRLHRFNLAAFIHRTWNWICTNFPFIFPTLPFVPFMTHFKFQSKNRFTFHAFYLTVEWMCVCVCFCLFVFFNSCWFAHNLSDIAKSIVAQPLTVLVWKEESIKNMFRGVSCWDKPLCFVCRLFWSTSDCHILLRCSFSKWCKGETWCLKVYLCLKHNLA